MVRRRIVDNLNIILKLLVFESSDDFYYLQIIQRKKENNLLKSNSRVIKSYYITSKDQLKDLYDEIITMCEMFNARAMIRLNRRSFVKSAFRTLANIGTMIANGQHESVRKSFDRICGKYNNEYYKKWILDIDGEFSKDWIIKLEEYIDSQKPVGDKVIDIVPSRNGFHIITVPFNCKNFNQEFPEVDLHKDSPTNLYIP